MPVALGIVLGVLLAVVFVTAALAKLTDLDGTRDALAGFGLPGALVAPGALVLPAVELAVAVLLLFGATRVVGAAGALGLLALFTVAVIANLARGRTPACHCFGRLHSAPAGWSTVARNAALAACAGAVLAAAGSGPEPDAFAWVGKLGLAELLALVAVLGAVGLAAAGGAAFLSLMRSQGRLLVEVEIMRRSLEAAGIDVEPEQALVELGRDPGTPAPDFATETATGQRIALGDLLEPGLPLLLTFTSPGCGPCAALLPVLSGWQDEHAGTLSFATIGADSATQDAYQVTGTPSAVLISADGQIASYLAEGAEAIELLVEGALRGDGDTQGLRIGAPAPPLELRDLDDRAVALADPAGRDTLVLFWNPGCGYCDAMRSDLLAWEGDAGTDAPRLIVVSSGDPEQSRADGFRSIVARDTDYAASEAFGAGGTPMGVLVDGDGRIASGLATGAAAVLALAGTRRAVRDESPLKVMR